MPGWRIMKSLVFFTLPVYESKQELNYWIRGQVKWFLKGLGQAGTHPSLRRGA